MKDSNGVEYMQTSMGYTCGCGKVFLIGWKHKETHKNYCDDCYLEHEDGMEKFEEKIY
jgi:hypothetical protein